MSDPQRIHELDFLWKSDPLDAAHKVKTAPPFEVAWAGIAEQTPRYIRSMQLKPDVMLSIVTTPALRRGYMARGANDFLLCVFDGLVDGQTTTLTVVEIARTREEADAWLSEDHA